ncbi:MAG: HupE/UreJ family protein [Verrucomicrobiota bacterium]
MLRLGAIFLLLATLLPAHEVEQHFLELHLTPTGFSGHLEMDAGYALPELRNPEDETVPTYTWLENQGPAGKERILTEGHTYLTRNLHFNLKNQPHPFQLTFKKWGTDTPQLIPETPNTIARMVWTIKSDYDESSGILELEWTERKNGPSLALITSTPSRELPPISIFPNDAHSLAKVSSKTVTSTPQSSFLSWLIQGFRHVLPLGLDHVLFILSLFLLSPQWKPLLTQSLVFTLAHSLTLALAVTGTIPVNPTLIEPLIALSIIYVALENLFLKELPPHRLLVVFALGLLHGLGFGSTMAELPLNPSALTIPILGFNLGVEAAQILILLLALALTFWWQQHKAYPPFRTASSLLLAAFALKLFLERLPVF